MKVRDLMDRRTVACSTSWTLDEAVLTMQRQGCDVLPVASPDGRITLGVISGCDVALALATHRRAAHEITVGEVKNSPVVVVAPDDEVRELLACMAHHRLRRVPVVDANGHLEGTVGVEELLRHARVSGSRHGELNAKDVLETLRAIWVDRRSSPRARPAVEEAHNGKGAPLADAGPAARTQPDDPAGARISAIPDALPVH